MGTASTRTSIAVTEKVICSPLHPFLWILLVYFICKYLFAICFLCFLKCPYAYVTQTWSYRTKKKMNVPNSCFSLLLWPSRSPVSFLQFPVCLVKTTQSSRSTTHLCGLHRRMLSPRTMCVTLLVSGTWPGLQISSSKEFPRVTW